MDGRGDVYRLNQDTTGNDRATVDGVLGPPDRSQFESVEQTQHAQLIEREAFTELTQLEIAAPETDTRPDQPQAREIDGPGLTAGPAGGGIADAFSQAGSILAGIGSLFGMTAPAPPPSKEASEAKRIEREAVAIDSERLLHDRDYRRAYEQQQREERERQAEERERENRERDYRQR